MSTTHDQRLAAHAGSLADSPVVPAVVPADLTNPVHFELHDVLRRVPDLLVGDLIAFEGEVREVEAVRLVKHRPGEVFLRLVDDPHDDAGRPVVRTFRDDAKVRVLASHWMAPQDEEDTGRRRPEGKE